MELKGKIIKSPAPEQPIEFLVFDFKCIGKIKDPSNYPLGQRGYYSRNYLRQIPDKRHHTQLFLAIQIIKQKCYRSFHEIMNHLGIGEVQPTLITSNECEDGAHPFTVTTLLDNENVPRTDDGSIDWSKDFFGKRVFMTVSSQLHLEATVLGTKRDGYCMTTAFRAEPSDTNSHLAEFLMPEWEVIGGGARRNMAIAQTALQYIFKEVTEECLDELKYLESFHLQEKIEENPEYKKEMHDLLEKKENGKIGKKKFSKERFEIKEKYKNATKSSSLIDRLKRYQNEPFVVLTHKKCIEEIQKAIESGILDSDMYLDYNDDLSRQHEYWICEVLGDDLPVFVTDFPKDIKAFYMPLVEEDPVYDKNGLVVKHVECYDLLLPQVGEVVGGSQRIHDAKELVNRMTEIGMSTEQLDWYVGLREDATLPHGGAGLGFGRLLVTLTGVHNIRDLQEFPRAYKLKCIA